MSVRILYEDAVKEFCNIRVNNLTVDGDVTLNSNEFVQYTPSVTGSTAGVVTYGSNRLGRYTRLSNSVSVSGLIDIASVSGASGDLIISLPESVYAFNQIGNVHIDEGAASISYGVTPATDSGYTVNCLGLAGSNNLKIRVTAPTNNSNAYFPLQNKAMTIYFQINYYTN